jgi:hypothetical protein
MNPSVPIPALKERGFADLLMRFMERYGLDFGVQSASEFNDFQRNSLRNGTGNFWRPNREIFSKNREFSRQNKEFDLGPIF